MSLHANPTEENSATKRFFAWLLRIALVLLGICVLLPTFLTSCPPNWVDRRKQRQTITDRVQSAGGWAVLQRDCDALVAQYRDSGFLWPPSEPETNQLPAAIAALKPKEIRFYPPSLLRDKDEPQVPVVQIKIFGVHSTGGHSTPYFGLEIVSGSGAKGYHPRPSRGGVSGNGYRSYRTVTDQIYEIY